MLMNVCAGIAAIMVACSSNDMDVRTRVRESWSMANKISEASLVATDTRTAAAMVGFTRARALAALTIPSAPPSRTMLAKISPVVVLGVWGTVYVGFRIYDLGFRI